MSHRIPWSLAKACAWILTGIVTLPGRAAEPAEVGAQRLIAPMASSKVAAALWTRRADRYTFQVVFPREGRMLPMVDGRRPAGSLPQGPSVTLWLLRADGTAIPLKKEPSLGAQQGVNTTEVAYSVPLAAGEEAVAAALRIDDEYFVEALQPLNGK